MTEEVSSKNVAEGLKVSKGDRLVDVVGIWGFRIQQTVLRGDYDLVATHSSQVIPEFLRILTNPNTDIGLRASVASALASFGLALDTAVYKSDRRPDNIEVLRKLREEAVEAMSLCLDYPLAVWGRTAITESLPQLTETESVKKLKEKLPR